jgi:hypothetical protein
MATTCKLIAKNVLGSTTASVTFSSIPGTYTDLLLVWSGASNRSGLTYTDVRGRFNGATSDTNHTGRWLYGNGASTASGTDTYCRFGYATGATATANTFGSNEIYIPNYAGSTNKSYSGTFVHETNATTAYMIAHAGLWSSTSAITSVEIIPDSASFTSGSSFFLYGITKS